MYTFEQLKEDVRKEAEALRVHATKEELAKLDITTFDPVIYDSCIYGQLAESCFSKRAAYLIFNCCRRYFKSQIDDSEDGLETMEEHARVGRVLELVNGETVKGINNAEDLATHRGGVLNMFHYSAIEAYIITPQARNANLIAYLRGETETLEL